MNANRMQVKMRKKGELIKILSLSLEKSSLHVYSISSSVMRVPIKGFTSASSMVDVLRIVMSRRVMED